MKDLYITLKTHILNHLKDEYGICNKVIELQDTGKDFEGDITVVMFPLLKFVKVKPEILGQSIGDYLIGKIPEVVGFNVVKGFLNLVISDDYYLNYLNNIYHSTDKIPYKKNETKEVVMVEYSSPNTNKPLHLGHIRNILLGESVSGLLECVGKKVYRTKIINDRGIHICKSMLAWLEYGNGETPKDSGIKGDKLVGKYYVLFDKHYKKEVADLMEGGMEKTVAEKRAPLLIKAQEMLQKWERKDPEIMALWRRMNSWVYEGFNNTYKSLGVGFDSIYYESETYILGKDIIKNGLQKGVFYKREDGSVWVDLTSDGLDEKLVLRSDGTSVYMTQDMGTAVQRTKDYPDTTGMVYTVGNEQDYHFKVLFLILKKLGYTWADNLYHLSYGMVDLPEGKMKSREGTVVDADDLIHSMTEIAADISGELGKLEGYDDDQKRSVYRTIGMGALKYYILKVDPKKRIVFNPKDSIDFNGNTGPFIQYSYARICSILRKAHDDIDRECDLPKNLNTKEKALIKKLSLLPREINEAAKAYSPALMANYIYDLVKTFNVFYQNISILKEEDLSKRCMRIKLCRVTGETIRYTMAILGIGVPEKM